MRLDTSIFPVQFVKCSGLTRAPPGEHSRGRRPIERIHQGPFESVMKNGNEYFHTVELFIFSRTCKYFPQRALGAFEDAACDPHAPTTTLLVRDVSGEAEWQSLLSEKAIESLVKAKAISQALTHRLANFCIHFRFIDVFYIVTHFLSF